MDDLQRFDGVARQYEAWAYPKPFADLDAAVQEGWVEPFDPDLLHSAYWPDRGHARDLDILVAGCGTNQAAHLAYTNPGSRVVGIDLSASSLRHAQFLKQKHGLDNLTLAQLDLRAVESLGMDFDFVLSTGVLHHLRDPASGLQALRQVMRPSAVIGLMLYSKYHRTGVYMMQELFRNLGLRQDEKGLELLKATLDILPDHHLARLHIEAAPDLAYDSGLVDTFLHTQDRAYSVRECLDLLETCGLRFQGWLDNFSYYPDATIPEQNPLFESLARLDEPKIWECMELLSADASHHSFFACRYDRVGASFAVDFDGTGLLDCIPVRQVGIGILEADEPGAAPFGLQRLHHPATPLSREQLLFIEQIDGLRTVAACLASAGLQGDSARLEQFARGFVKSLWRMGHVLLRKA